MHQYLSTHEAAVHLGLKDQTLRAWRLRGVGPPYHRLGSHPRARCIYKLADLEAWLAERRFSSTAEETVRAPESWTPNNPMNT